jgi:hypothetical protein
MLENPVRDKRSSLLPKFVNYSRKRAYNIGPWTKNLIGDVEVVEKSGLPKKSKTWCQCYKTLFFLTYEPIIS